MDRPNAVSGLLNRNRLTLFAPNAFSRNSFLFFSPEELGQTPEELAEAKDCSFRIVEEEWNDAEDYTAYLTLKEPEPMAYETFFEWCIDHELTQKQGFWCAVHTEGVTAFWSGLGFSMDTVHHQSNLWNQEHYPNLVMNGNSWKPENVVRQHFLSLLQYTLDYPEFTKIMGTWPEPQMEEILKETAAYVEENGLFIRGFAFRGKKADFMQLEADPMICNISPMIIY